MTKSVFDEHPAATAGAELGPAYRQILQFTKHDSRLLGERTASRLNLGLKMTARVVFASILATLMVMGLTLLGMCFVLGLQYTLSLPLIAVLGVGAIVTVGAAMLRAANRQAFMRKVDAFLEFFGIDTISSEKNRDKTSLVERINSDALSTGPASTTALTAQHDLQAKGASDSLRVDGFSAAPGVGLGRKNKN